MSVHFFTYSDTHRLKSFAKGVEGALSGESFKISIGDQTAINFDNQLTSNQITTLQNFVNTFDGLDELKQNKMSEIDSRTDELILNGFEYPTGSGDIFSMSVADQILISNIPATKNMLTYPYGITIKDNLKTIQIADVAEMDAYYMAAFVFMTTIKNAGEALRASVRVAVSKYEIDAIVDNRS